MPALRGVWEVRQRGSAEREQNASDPQDEPTFEMRATAVTL
jgi:hypothetical protein